MYSHAKITGRELVKSLEKLGGWVCAALGVGMRSNTDISSRFELELSSIVQNTTSLCRIVEHLHGLAILSKPNEWSRLKTCPVILQLYGWSEVASGHNNQEFPGIF